MLTKCAAAKYYSLSRKYKKSSAKRKLFKLNEVKEGVGSSRNLKLKRVWCDRLAESRGGLKVPSIRCFFRRSKCARTSACAAPWHECSVIAWVRLHLQTALAELKQEYQVQSISWITDDIHALIHTGISLTKLQNISNTSFILNNCLFGKKSFNLKV